MNRGRSGPLTGAVRAFDFTMQSRAIVSSINSGTGIDPPSSALAADCKIDRAGPKYIHSVHEDWPQSKNPGSALDDCIDARNFSFSFRRLRVKVERGNESDPPRPVRGGNR